MKSRSFLPHLVLLTFVLIVAAVSSALAQDGKLRLHANLKQAYVWVDDRAISEGSKHPSMQLSAGEHKVELANYGYTPITRIVTITAGQTTDLDITLEKVGEKVSGPFGAIARLGPASYNQLLSERRAELVRSFLVEQGVPESSIDVQAFGKKDNLTTEQVQQLLEQSPDLSTQTLETVTQQLGNIVLAYNHRVDLTLSSTGQESARAYPFNAGDFAPLSEREPKNGRAAVQLAAEKEHIGD